MLDVQGKKEVSFMLFRRSRRIRFILTIIVFDRILRPVIAYRIEFGFDFRIHFIFNKMCVRRARCPNKDDRKKKKPKHYNNMDYCLYVTNKYTNERLSFIVLSFYNK